MKEILLFFVLLLIRVPIVHAQYSGIKNKAKETTTAYMALIYPLKLCNDDTTVQEDCLYGYCDSDCYNIYNLAVSKGAPEKLLLIEVVHNTGTNGYDYYIVQERN